MVTLEVRVLTDSLAMLLKEQDLLGSRYVTRAVLATYDR